MKLSTCLTVLNTPEMEQIHRASLDILTEPGMKIMEDSLLRALEKAGAKVDDRTEQVRFPPEPVKEVLAGIREEIESGKRFPVLNGAVCSFTDGRLAAKFGGACCNYYDWEAGANREPTPTDVIRMLRLGEALPEVRHVGNPVIYMREGDGTPVPPHLRPVKTAATLTCRTPAPSRRRRRR